MSTLVREIKSIKLQEIRGCIVGGCVAVLVDYIMYMLLMDELGVMSAKTVSYIIGASVGFVINKNLAFHSKGFLVSEIVKYIVLYGGSALLNAWINRNMVEEGYSPVSAFLTATAITTIVNFLGQKFVVFRTKR